MTRGRDREAAREGVQHLGRVVVVPRDVVYPRDLPAEPVEVGAGLPLPVEDAAHRLSGVGVDVTAQPLQELGARLLVAGIGQQRGDQRGAAGGQRSARRPDVQRGDVPVPDVLLVGCV